MSVTKPNLRIKKPDISPLIYGKLPPQALELEAAVLGAIMLEGNKLSVVSEIIQSPDCFYADNNQRIYAAILRLFDKGSAIDFMTVGEELKRNDELELAGGYYYVTSLTRDVVSAANIEEHARIVMQKFIMRELIRISGEIISDAYENHTDVFDLLDKAESGLYTISDKHLRKNFNSLNSILINTIKEIEDQKESTDDLTGITSGFRDLDRLTGGWQKTDLIILAARPAVGKTAFALNLVMNAAMNAVKPTTVAFFSLEMSAGQIVRRMLSATTDVPLSNISKGNLADHEIVQLHQRMGKLSDAKIFLDDQAALNIFELRSKCRKLKQRENLGFVVIDYLQLMTASIDKSGNREQEISKISRDLKALAKELEIPIIALSQLNRGVETRKESKVPQLSDLRESGAIEQDADMVMFLYRPDYYQTSGAPTNANEAAGVPGETWINVAKHRNGQTDIVKVVAELAYQRFIDKPDNDFINTESARNNNSGAGIKGNFDGPSLQINTNFKTQKSKADDFIDDDKTDVKNLPDGDAPF
jgi:replicative DNA helicase